MQTLAKTAEIHEKSPKSIKSCVIDFGKRKEMAETKPLPFSYQQMQLFLSLKVLKAPNHCQHTGKSNMHNSNSILHNFTHFLPFRRWFCSFWWIFSALCSFEKLENLHSEDKNTKLDLKTITGINGITDITVYKTLLALLAIVSAIKMQKIN